MRRYVAIDLGASNGRCVTGQFDGERLSLEVLHRFENGPIELMGHLYWDVLGLYRNICQSLQSLRLNDPGGYRTAPGTLILRSPERQTYVDAP